jgi:hypothetical protein
MLSCSSCTKILSSKYTLTRHYLTCKLYLKDQELKQTLNNLVQAQDEKEYEFQQELQQAKTALTQAQEDKDKSITLFKQEQLTKQNEDLKKDITEYKKEIEHLRNINSQKDNLVNKISSQLLTIQSKPTKIINNTQINNNYNLLPLTDNFIQMMVDKSMGEKSNINQLKSNRITSEDAFAQYALKNGLDKCVVITDAARNTISWKDDKDVTVKDPNAKTLSTKIYNAARPAFQKLLENLQDLYNLHLNKNPPEIEEAQNYLEWIKFCKAIIKMDNKSVRRFGQQLGKYAPTKDTINQTGENKYNNLNLLLNKVSARIISESEVLTESVDSFSQWFKDTIAQFIVKNKTTANTITLFNDKKEEIQLNINDIFNIINLCIELNGSDAVKNRVVMDMLPSSKRKEAKKTLEEFDNRMKWFINNKTESDEMVITGDTNVVLLKEKLGMINEIKDN